MARQFAGVVLAVVVFVGAASADEYKGAKFLKVEASGEATIEVMVKDKKVTKTIWPYVKMKVVGSDGKPAAPSDLFEVGVVADITTSKSIVKGMEAVTTAKILDKKAPPKDKKDK